MKDGGCIHTKLPFFPFFSFFSPHLCWGRALWCWVTMEWKRNKIIHTFLSARTVTAGKSLIHLLPIVHWFYILIILLIYTVLFLQFGIGFSAWKGYTFLWFSFSYGTIPLFWGARTTTAPGLEKVKNCHALKHSHFFKAQLFYEKIISWKILDRYFSGMQVVM